VGQCLRKTTPFAISLDVSQAMMAGSGLLDTYWAILRNSKRLDRIIKRDLRRESEADWLEKAHALGTRDEPRPGKQLYAGTTWRQRGGKLYRV
jgi:hypothetical protein